MARGQLGEARSAPGSPAAGQPRSRVSLLLPSSGGKWRSWFVNLQVWL